MTTSDPRIEVNGPGDYAELLPFLIGHHPEDTIAVHGRIATGVGTGPTMTLPLPEDSATWQPIAEAFATQFHHITHDHGRHDVLDIIVFLCRNPRP